MIKCNIFILIKNILLCFSIEINNRLTFFNLEFNIKSLFYFRIKKKTQLFNYLKPIFKLILYFNSLFSY